jgi:hypothetical protein
MEKTDAGTSVGVADPYAHVDRCDHLTDEGRCRFAVEQGDRDPAFARERRQGDYACPAADPAGEWEWADCPHFRCRNRDRECARCGLAEVRLAHDDARPLLEEHHLSYRTGSSHGDGDPGHEITVYLCRWCHATVHRSWGAVTDDVAPDPEAIAAREARRSKEQAELGFTSAAERFDRD